MELALSLGWMVFVSWLILRAFKQRNLFPVLGEAPPSGEIPPRMSVIIPARNEGRNLTRCINALRNQHYPVDRLLIVIVDDHSSDETFAIASAMQHFSSQVIAIKSSPLPPGWSGANH